MGLDKTPQGYQEEGVIKILKDIRDGLAGGVNRGPNDNRPDDGFDDGFDDDSFDDDSFDKPYTSDDEDDIKNNLKKYNNLLLKYFQLRKNVKETKDKLDKTKDDTSEEIKDELDEKDDTSKKSYDSHGFDIMVNIKILMMNMILMGLI